MPCPTCVDVTALSYGTLLGSALRVPSRVGGGVRLRKSAEFREEEPLQTRLEQPQPGIPCCERRGEP